MASSNYSGESHSSPGLIKSSQRLVNGKLKAETRGKLIHTRDTLVNGGVQHRADKAKHVFDEDHLTLDRPNPMHLLTTVQMNRLACESFQFLHQSQMTKYVGAEVEEFNLKLKVSLNSNEKSPTFATCNTEDDIVLERRIHGNEKGADVCIFSRRIYCPHNIKELVRMEIQFCFVGTMDVMDHVQDLKFWSSKYKSQALTVGADSYVEEEEPIFSGACVYSGPFEAAAEVYKTLVVEYQRLCKKYEGRLSNMKENKNRKPGIVISGHSLGGATCTFFYSLLLSSGYKDIVCYTLGSTKVGNQAFRRLLHHRSRISNSKIYRVYVQNDIVQYLPPGNKYFGVPYCHVGCPVVVEDTEPKVLSFGPDPSKKTRISAFFQECKKERELLRLLTTGFDHMIYYGVDYRNIPWLSCSTRPMKHWTLDVPVAKPPEYEISDSALFAGCEESTQGKGDDVHRERFT